MASQAPDQDRVPSGTALTTPPTSRKKSKKPKLKKDGTPYKPRKGWGPYRSVPNERSVAFNLQLDVQNLQQEVCNLLSLRDILQTKSLVQRHTPEGSLTRLVNEYLDIFRKGAVPEQPGRGHIVENKDQRAFMHSVMDPDVELGPGLPRGPDVIMDQMIDYTNFLCNITLTGVVDSILLVEDSVLISDAAMFTYQVTRSTIEMIFPHIMSEEWLVAMLVGKEVKAQGRSTFHFNTSGKCYKYDVEMDFVAGLMDIVKDPRIVDMLLGKALISYNGMLSVTCEDSETEDEEKAPAPRQHNIHPAYDGNKGPKPQNTREDGAANPTQTSTSAEFCRRIVKDYFSAFTNGYEEDTVTASGVSQRDFFLYRFGSQKEVEVTAIVNQLRERWRALRECFELLTFQKKGGFHTECADNNSSCLVVSDAIYILRITIYTIQTVFPHLLYDSLLRDTLVGKVIMVPSQIFFSIKKTTGYISRINERMDFAAAMADIISDRKDLTYVISQAKLTSSGVDLSIPAPSTSSPPAHFQDQTQTEGLERPRISSNSGSSSRTMRIRGILD